MILRIAIATPLRRLFDYLPPSSSQPIRIGMRVIVPFGKRKLVGIVVEMAEQSEVPANKLKAASAVLDDTPLLDANHLAWLEWVNQYYHHALGDTLFSALPVALRQDRPAEAKAESIWKISTTGLATEPSEIRGASKQQALLAWLQQQPKGVGAAQLNEQFSQWRPSIKRLEEKGLVQCETQLPCLPPLQKQSAAPQLNDEQKQASLAVKEALNKFGCFLLDGVTGSGKTEVYLDIVNAVLSEGKQALIVVPEIGLTPQLIQRVRSRINAPLSVLHSGLNESERLNAWLAARNGVARVVIGTRSAVLIPLKEAGVIIIDEEHDLSLKQMDGLRYHARDIAIARGHRQQFPIVLGSATPSLESLLNARQGRYQHLKLRQRAGNARPPAIRTLDLRGQLMLENMARPLLDLAEKHLQQGRQVLLFLNRRGFAPTLICHACGHVEHCRRCDSHMTLHQQSGRLRCHHCGAERPIPKQCPSCSELDIRPRGYGTERVEAALKERFPDYSVFRIDRDTTRRKGSFEQLIEQVRDGRGQILLGTQMLAKGHDFPNVTLVGILDADQGLFGADFRATERLAQLITQVAGRAGRGDTPGTVIIQTHHPEHPLLQTLIQHGFHGFAEAALTERQQAHFPPFHHAALLRAEAVAAQQAMDFLQTARDICQQNTQDIEYLGPIPAPMERRAGRFRAQLLLLSAQRAPLHRGLETLVSHLESLPEARKVRWSVDVDPQDLN